MNIQDNPPRYLFNVYYELFRFHNLLFYYSLCFSVSPRRFFQEEKKKQRTKYDLNNIIYRYKF